MRSSIRKSAVLAMAIWIQLGALFAAGVRAQEASFFAQRVAPVLRQRCVQCHNSQKSRGGLDLTSRERLHQGGEQGPVVVPGNSAKSRLIEMVSGTKPR